MAALQDRLALHTWTLDTTPLREVLRVVRETGWNAIELRRIDFTRSFEAGMTNAAVIELIRASGVKVAVLGTEYGLVFASGDEQRRLLKVLAETCANAVALGCNVVMIAPGQNTGTLKEGAKNLRSAGEVAKAHGVRLAVEFNSRHEVINCLNVAREILALADHPSCGLLLDAYHLERSGSGGRGFADVPAAEIFTFQYSDVPKTPPTDQKRPTDRLPPGQGIVRWREVFELLVEKNYQGYLSYEAPNPVLWSRPPAEVAREGVAATRALIGSAKQGTSHPKTV
jgi:2-keto-myo-inositol isomerase